MDQLLKEPNQFATNHPIAQQDQQKPGFFQRIIHVFHKDKPEQEKNRKTGRDLELTMVVSPQPLKLSETHEIQVTLRVTNNTSKVVQLDFPTTQRVEVLLRNPSGKLVTQWSENQSFENDPSDLILNPREHIEYAVNISGRDMVAGQTYTVEGFLPNYERLKASQTVIPVR